jgi:2-polyprenyl-3-methyl-5-hydroxy-6-metoxy-1,4-benzoquinol methylase
MTHQFAHAMLPEASHDESARQDFTASLKRHISAEVTPGNRAVAERRAVPAFRQQHGRAPRTRGEMRGALEREDYHQMWGSLTRLAQEQMWHSVEESVARQVPELASRWRSNGRAKGSLHLDSSLEAPGYMSAVDIHCMPGGYASEVVGGDVRAGAIFDRGTFLNVCGTQGAMHDARGRTAVAYLLTDHAELNPARILDMGCSVGQATLPYAAHFPNAEVHAIDVAAPLLRYAHGRAESVGRTVHFSQQNAEATDFPGGHFDLIVSHLLFHETSTRALPRIIHECHRLLRPGGVMVHLELGLPYKDLDLFEEVMHDWQTRNNGEPFWTTINTTDTVAIARAAGFGRAESGYLRRVDDPRTERVHLGPKAAAAAGHVFPQGDRGRDEFYFVLSAVK